MALSGSFTTSVDNGHYRLKVNWSATQDIANNTSTISAKAYFEGDYAANIGSRANCKITIDGTAYTFTAPAISQGGSFSVQIGTASKTVTHNSDGTKSVTMSAYYTPQATLDGTYYNSMTASSGTVTLNTIPRGSTFTNFGGFTIAGNATVNLSVGASTHSSAFNMDFTLKIGTTVVGTWNDIACNGSTQTVTLALTTAMQNIILNALPSATSGVVVLTMQTHNGTTNIGSSVGTSATCTLDISVLKPAITSFTAAEANSNVASIVGKYVQNLSAVTFNIASKTIPIGASYSSCTITFNGASYNSYPVTTPTITASGTITAHATIKDSRGVSSAEVTVDVPLLAYAVPAITAFTLQRASDSGGTLSDLGTYCKLTTAGNAYSLMNSTEKNTLTYTIYSRVKGATSWGTALKTATISGLSLNVTNVFGAATGNAGAYEADTSYEFLLYITDKFNTTAAIVVLSTGIVTMSWDNLGVGIGKIRENGALDVNGDIYESGAKLSDKYLAIANLLSALKTVDGSGSGLDADTLDGNQASAFLLTSAYTAADILSKLKTVDGSGTGLDADLIDGKNILTGTVNLTFACTTAYGGLFYGDVTVPFGTTLAVAPKVFTNNNTSGIGAVMVKSTTITGFSARVFNGVSTSSMSLVADWIAIW